eukprot:ANDGO_04695.mRNA.1 Methylsterol monooxygenase 2-2
MQMIQDLIASGDSALAFTWNLVLVSQDFIANDVLFGIAIQQFLQYVYVISSVIMTAIFLYYHHFKRGEERPPALRLSFILKWLAINTVVLFIVAAVPPYLGLKAIFPRQPPTLLEFSWQFLVEMFWYDIIFYSIHYALHANTWLYKNIHSVHHQCNPVIAIHSQVIHPVEMLLMALPAILPGVVLNYHPMSYLMFQTLLVVYGGFVHAHFETNVEKWSLGVFCGCISHGRHHTACDTNYGGFTTFMDRIFGTYSFDKHCENNTPVDAVFREIDTALFGRETTRKSPAKQPLSTLTHPHSPVIFRRNSGVQEQSMIDASS